MNLKTIGRQLTGRAVGLAVCLLACGVHGLKADAASRQTLNFDADWRFLKADAEGAEKPEFDDSAWRKLDVPHDWSIEGPFSETNSTGGAGGFLPAGIGWYRKELKLGTNEIGRDVCIEFDGVMANSDVWINGHHLGERPYGYVSFSYNLTPFLNFGNDRNVLAVRADNSRQPASRWYSGAGIYRHVRLVSADSIHIEQWSTFVTTPKVNDQEAAVRVQCTVTNDGSMAASVLVRVSLHDPRGRPAGIMQSEARILPPGQSADFSTELIIKNPQGWNLDRPELYLAQTEVRSGNQSLDTVVTPFGIRDFEFKSDTGFWLNGKNFKIKGVCLHEDGSAFGSAIPLGVWERRLAALKDLGVNAIRTAHNPPAPEFLDLCDRMGFLVMDEFFDCWTVGKNRYDYHLYFDKWSKTDARDTVRRDRNHPSVILYSVGNEIHDTPKAEPAKSILKGLVEICHENDPTRPVTQALFRPNVSHDFDDGLADMLDVIGTNYRDSELLAAQRARPDRKIIGTEQGHDRRTWLYLRETPSHSGQFLWTGIDYLGESRHWPVVAAGSGLLDRTGMPRPLAFERKSWWSDQPMVFIARRVSPTQETSTDPGFTPLDRRQVLFADWSPHDRAAHDENVEIYSNCQSVELFLNGKSLGSKPLNTDASTRNWKVPFESGILKAVAKNNELLVAQDEIRTAEKPNKIVLYVDRSKLSADWDDVACARAMVMDVHGVLVPDADEMISFKIEGPGVVVAVDSADNTSHEPFQATARRAFQGRCFAILKATHGHGVITLTASAPGLGSTSIKLIVL